MLILEILDLKVELRARRSLYHLIYSRVVEMVSDFFKFYSKKWDANDDFSAIPKFSVCECCGKIFP